MAASFPIALLSQTTPSSTNYQDDAGVFHDILHTSEINEITAIETYLGTNTTQSAPTAANNVLVATSATASTWKSTLSGITLVAPVLGVATATTINKVTLTTPATGSTLTIANGKTLTANNSLTLAGVDGKTLTLNNNLTLAGTDGTTMTFPSTSATIARTDAANTFTGHQTIEGVTSTGATGTGKFVFDTSPTLTSPTINTPTFSAGAVTPAAIFELGTWNVNINPIYVNTVVQGNAWGLVVDTAEYLGGHLINNTAAQNDEVSWKVLLQAGTYTLNFVIRTDGDEGIATITLGGVSAGTFDCYSASTTKNVAKQLTGVVIPTSGLQTLDLKMATKNASASAYAIRLQTINIIRTA